MLILEQLVNRVPRCKQNTREWLRRPLHYIFTALPTWYFVTKWRLSVAHGLTGDNRHWGVDTAVTTHHRLNTHREWSILPVTDWPRTPRLNIWRHCWGSCYMGSLGWKVPPPCTVSWLTVSCVLVIPSEEWLIPLPVWDSSTPGTTLPGRCRLFYLLNSPRALKRIVSK